MKNASFFKDHFRSFAANYRSFAANIGDLKA